MADPETLTLHATAVAVDGRGVLVTGTSGAGKSSLALEMMVRGATLVADDRVDLHRSEGAILLSCPGPLCGLIEARGVGLLHADYTSPVELCLVVDMDRTETARLPQDHAITYLGETFPLLHNVASQHFPASILQYLKNGGRADVQP